MEEDILKRFKRFLTEHCDADEVHKVITWVNSPEAREFLEGRFDKFTLKEEIEFDSEGVFTEILDQIYSKDLTEKIYRSLDGNSGTHVSMTPVSQPGRFKRSFWIAAASISIILLTYLGGYYTSDIKESIPVAFENELITKSTENGQKLTFHLSDGTMVKLNSNSSLRFPVENSVNKREVWLEGEAFFEVAENPEKPFIVNTDQLSTTALGTSFTVRAFSSIPNEVFLLTGKVNVKLNEDPSHDQLLEAGQSVIYDSSKSDFKVSEFNTEFETAWKDGVLAFQESPYEEVIKKLESWYGVKVVVSGKVPDNLYSSAKFQNDYLLEVMKSLAYSWGFEFDIREEKNIIQIKFNQNNK